jgi:hypothetical protein
MAISMNWVKEYVDLKNVDLKELATKITKAGVNIEAVITNHIDHLVIGEVVECIDHPADVLRLFLHLRRLGFTEHRLDRWQYRGYQRHTAYDRNHSR